MVKNYQLPWLDDEDSEPENRHKDQEEPASKGKSEKKVDIRIGDGAGS